MVCDRRPALGRRNRKRPGVGAHRSKQMSGFTIGRFDRRRPMAAWVFEQSHAALIGVREKPDRVRPEDVVHDARRRFLLLEGLHLPCPNH